MKTRFIYFITADGKLLAYPLLDLRWQCLKCEEELELGFAGETVTLRGKGLGVLLQGIANGEIDEIRAVVERHVQAGQVFSIAPHPR